MLRPALFVPFVLMAACGTPPDVPPLTSTGPAPALLPLDALPQTASRPEAPDLAARVARLRARAAALR